MNSLRILILVPTVLEQMFFSLPGDRFDVQVIGTGRYCVENIRIDEAYERAILFGMCGIMQHSHNKSVLFVPEQVYNFELKKLFDVARIDLEGEVWRVSRGATTGYSVNSNALRVELLDWMYFDIVDQEDAWVAAYFAERQMAFSVVRYGIDYCNRGLKTKPVYRKIYRYFQHWRMQREFRRCLMLNIK